MNSFQRFLLTALVALLPVSGSAATGDGPIYIRADRLQTETAARTALFTGSVVARQNDLVIYADRMTVHYSDGGKNVDKVDCVGTVRIVQGARTATAAKAVYDNGAGKITLTGNPRVYQGEDVVSGGEIVYSVADQRTVVTGSPESRVEVVIHPKSGAKDGGSKP